MTERDALAYILRSGGRPFSVVFVKRTDGEVRHMNASTDCRSLLRGGVAAYDAGSRGLVVVQDLDKHAVRSIPLENLVRIKLNGRWHEVEHPSDTNANGTTE
jgi:hypothetical protein